MNKSKKKFFTVIVIDEMFGQFSGEFFASSWRSAKKAARQWYAFEFGTQPDEIEILSVKEGRMTI